MPARLLRLGAVGSRANGRAVGEAGSGVFERGRAGPWRFQATPEGAAILGRFGARLLADPTGHGGASLVKESPVRSVYRLGADGLYLKLYRTVGAGAFLRSLFRPSRAEREWGNALRLRDAGLGTAEPLACGASRRGPFPGEAFYLCREVEGARSAEEYFRALGTGRAAGLRGLAALLAAVHRAGFAPRDLHARDVLVRDGAPPEYFLVDLHAVRRPLRLTIRGRARGLAGLLRGMREALRGEIERRLFVEAYLEAAGLTSPEAFLPRLREEEARLERTFRRSRGRRCLESSREFVEERAGGRRVFRRREIPREAVEAALAAHAAGTGRVLDRNPRGRTTLVPAPGRGSWLVKETRAGGILHSLADLLRGSRARRAWRGAHLLGLLGRPVPRALALVEEKAGPLVLRSFLLREYVEDAVTLREFLARGYAGLAPAVRAGFVRGLARAVGCLHRDGLRHRDLSTKNVLLRPAGASFEFLLIDLEDLEPARETSEARRLAALVQLNDCPAVVSRAARLRFLRSYEETTGVPLAKSEIGEVAARARARAALRGETAKG